MLFILLFLCSCVIFIIPIKTFAGALSTSDFIDKLEMNGDLRIRYEYRKKDISSEDTIERLRQRFRLGMKWNNPEENWKVAAGLTTGPSDATSTDQTYSDQKFFDKGNISLDYAYAEHKLYDFKFVAGQQKNPFESSWLLWDTDVRPAGFTGRYAMNGFFATAGWYQDRYINNDIAQMDAVQAGVKMEMATAALAFYNFHRTDEILKDLKITGVDPDYKYQIVDLFASGIFRTEPVEFKPYAQVFYNIGAEGEKGQDVLNATPGGSALDPEAAENDLGWIIGVESRINRFSVKLDYMQVGADSCVGGLKDATFGADMNLTDVEGFRVGLGYKLTKNCWLDATGFFYEAKERDIDQNPTIYQFDLNYKF